MERITASFDHMHDAEAAVRDLRNRGVTNRELSIVTHHPNAQRADDNTWQCADRGAGDVIDIAAAFIPGAGPFVTAGALTPWLGAGDRARSADAAVDPADAIAMRLVLAGYDKDRAGHYSREVEQGRVLLAVDSDTSQRPDDDIVVALERHHGRTHETRARD